MDTAPVARDIIEIFERHGEWREKEALDLMSSAAIGNDERTQVLERTRYHKDAEQVQYWGYVSTSNPCLCHR